MSRRKILAALKKKGLSVSEIEYQRGCPTPSGYANGWTIMLDEKSEALCCSVFPDGEWEPHFDGDIEEVLEWVSELPCCIKTVPFVVQLLKDDHVITLMAKGEHEKAAIINEAIEQEEIDIDNKARFESGYYEVQWMKAVPHNEGGTYYHQSKEGIRGAFLASMVFINW